MIIMTSLYVALVLVLVYVSYCDVRYRIIPNGASLAILVGFFAIGILHPISLSDWILHGMIGVIAFAVTLGLFAMRLLGGGDVKLFSALAFYMGSDMILSFLLLMTLIGGCLGILRLGAFLYRDFLAGHRINLRSALRADIPYGLAIAIAAIFTLPRTNLFAPLFAGCSAFTLC